MLEHWHMVALFLIVYDLVSAAGAYWGALWLRFDCRYTMIPEEYLHAWLRFLPIYLPVCRVVFMCTHLYQSIWQFASYNELKCVVVANAVLGIFHTVAITLLFKRMPISYYAGGIVIQFMCLAEKEILVAMMAMCGAGIPIHRQLFLCGMMLPLFVTLGAEHPLRVCLLVVSIVDVDPDFLQFLVIYFVLHKSKIINQKSEIKTPTSHHTTLLAHSAWAEHPPESIPHNSYAAR